MRHVVVDGSNLATEGRAMPSLRQLLDAVQAFRDENPDDILTVVVDATFGHRIDSTEVAEFDTLVERNEIVSPPAGAVGRGDAFVLTIANKAAATILSNDSFQEFHGDYPWLFDESRLIGGKPVPHVGWVFVPRVPVRGPLSRKSVRVAKRAKQNGMTVAAHAEVLKGRRASKAASEPMPTPKSPPPRARAAVAASGAPALAGPAAVVEASGVGRAAASRPAGGGSKASAALNDALPFLEFVPRHPIGSPVEGTVESFSSHGAYVVAEGVRCYVPLRNLGSPAPRAARLVLSLGDTKTFRVVKFDATRRGVDLALEPFIPHGIELIEAPEFRPTKKSAAKRARRARAEKAAEAAKTADAARTGRGVEAAPKRVAKAAKRADKGATQVAKGATQVAKGATQVAKGATQVAKAAKPVDKAAPRRVAKAAKQIERAAKQAPSVTKKETPAKKVEAPPAPVKAAKTTKGRGGATAANIAKVTQATKAARATRAAKTAKAGAPG